MSEPTSEWIEKAKGAHGRLGKVIIGGQTYIFRQLKRKEHIDIQKAVFPNGVPSDPQVIKAEENEAIEDKIMETCVIWPEKLDVANDMAGVPQSLTPSILLFSGFGPPQEAEEI
jgi:hypothetical protein